jgi:hypothetical protein
VVCPIIETKVLLLKQDSHWKSAGMNTSDYSFINNEKTAIVVGPMMDTRVRRVDDQAPAVTVCDAETVGSLVAVVVVAANGEEVGSDEETTGSLVGTGPQQYGAYAAAYLAQKASLKRL